MNQPINEIKQNSTIFLHTRQPFFYFYAHLNGKKGRSKKKKIREMETHRLLAERLREKLPTNWFGAVCRTGIETIRPLGAQIFSRP